MNMSLTITKSAAIMATLAAAVLLGAIQDGSAVVPNVLVGAIRWDGWQENSKIQAGLEQVLGPNHWHYRLPFFTKVTGSNSVAFNGNSQATMDQEINYAANAGIDYWAFDIYPDAFGMSNGLHLYLQSPFKSRISFAQIMIHFESIVYNHPRVCFSSLFL